MSANTTTKTVRNFSPCGPCIEQGVLIKETAKFYVFIDRFNRPSDSTATRMLRKRTESHYSRAHVEPCPSCMDHPKTQYPNGYMD